MIKLTVIIPAYNEGKRIVPTLESVGAYLKNQKYESEVIVVSNGSTDDTAEVSRTFEEHINNLVVMDIPGKGGKGYAVQEGMLKARGEYAVFMDADNATKIDEMDHFWKFFEQGYDVVIGSRALPSSIITNPQPWYRKVLGKGGNMLIQMLLLPGIKDTQCGFKAFSKKARKAIFPYLTIYGWGFDFETLAIARSKGLNIKEEAVTWNDEGDSKVQPVDAAISTLKELFLIRKNLNKKIYDSAKKRTIR